MKLIYYEIKKVVSKRLFISLFVFCFAVNLCAFYFTHNDYQAEMYRECHEEYEAMAEMYSNMPPDEALSEILEDEQAIEILYIMQNVAVGTQDNMIDYELSQLEGYRKTNPEAYKKAEEMLTDYFDNESTGYFRSILKMQLQYLNEYPDFVGEMRERANAQTEFSVFSDKDSFSYKNIMKTAEDYDGLRNTKLTLGSDYPLISALTYNIGDYFVIAIVFLACIYLFRFERDKGLSNLVRSSKNGRLKTALSKLCGLMILTVMITITVEFSTIAESTILFGSWELSRPIQSIRDFQNCVLPVRCDDFCLLYLISKAEAMAVIAAIISLIFVAVPSSVTSYAISGTILAAEFVLYHAVSQDALFNHLKYINIFYMLDGSRFFGKYLNLNIFRMPIASNVITSVIMLILLAVCVVVSLIIFTVKGQETSKNPLAETIEKFFRSHAKINGSTAVLAGEMYKYLISSKMAAVILVMVIFAVSSSLGSVMYRTNEESVIAYRQYISAVEGQKPSQAQNYIENEKRSIDSADTNTAIKKNDFLPAEITAAAQDRANSRRQGFYMLYEQYLRLTELEESGVDARFIDEIVYSDYIYNDIREWRAVLTCFLLMIITVPFMFTYEYRKNMIDLLQATKNGRKKLFRAKLTVVMMSAFITFLVSFLPFVIRFKNSFGSKCMNIPIVCISDFESCGLTISVGTAYFIELLIYFFLTIAAAAVIVMLSIYVRNHMLTAIFSAVVLIIPCLVLYSLKNARAGAIYNGNSMTKIIILITALLITAAVLIFVSIRKFTKSTVKGS